MQAPFTARTATPRMLPLGLALAAAYWLIESLIHTLVFRSGSWSVNLLGGSDPNELSMRLTVALLLVASVVIAQRSALAERRLKADARHVDNLGRFVARVRREFQHSVDDPRPAFRDRRGTGRLDAAGAPMPSGDGGQHRRIDDLSVREDEIGQLSRMLKELSGLLETRFRELYALLQLTHEINEGLLLDEVLDKAYGLLRSVIPYDRLGVALIDERGETASARWVRSDAPAVLLGSGFSAPLRGSSLQQIIDSGEPRIINDLAAHLRAHPGSESTRLLVAEGVRASLTCPLVAAGRPVGFVFFSSRNAFAYRTVHVDIFKLIAGHLSVVVDKSNVYQQVLSEKEKSERLLLNVMPARIADRLRAGEETIAEGLPEVNVLFADIVDFTAVAGALPPESVVCVLRDFFGHCDQLCDRYGVEKIKTIGDEYLAINGLTAATGDAELRSIAAFALELRRTVEQFRYPDGRPVPVRIGLHTGPVVAGVIGQKKFAYDIWGNTVNVASRMESTGEPGRIHVTREVYLRLQDRFALECRGPVEVKGKGRMTTYFLEGEKQPR